MELPSLFWVITISISKVPDPKKSVKAVFARAPPRIPLEAVGMVPVFDCPPLKKKEGLEYKLKRLGELTLPAMPIGFVDVNQPLVVYPTTKVAPGLVALALQAPPSELMIPVMEMLSMSDKTTADPVAVLARLKVKDWVELVEVTEKLLVWLKKVTAA